MVYFSIICTKNKSYVEAMCFCPCFVRLFPVISRHVHFASLLPKPIKSEFRLVCKESVPELLDGDSEQGLCRHLEVWSDRSSTQQVLELFSGGIILHFQRGVVARLLLLGLL